MEIREAISYYSFLGEEQYIVNDTFDIIDEVRDCKALFDELEKTLSASWDYMLGEARKYYEANGDLLPLLNYETVDGYKLGQWVVSQRLAYTKKELSAERVKQLEAVGMNWLNLHQRQWEEGYALAKDYYDKHGNLSLADSRSKLGTWIIRQRQNYKKQLLTKEQFNRLNRLGMVWEVEDVWQKRINEAQAFYQKYGNLDIPVGYISETGVRLGVWYRSVKKQYKAGLLSDKRIEQLESIGIMWSSVRMRNWMRFYELAKDYYRENGDLNINANYKTDTGEALGNWISAQRYSYSNDKLSRDQIDLLNEIGMSWHRDKSRWETAYSYAVEYHSAFGNINATADYTTPDEFALGAWVANQRRKYKCGKLTDKQITRLEKLGIEWEPSEAMWITAYEHAMDYYREHGNLLVNNQFVSDDGFKLGSWISNQKTKYRKGKLEKEQIRLLEKIGMIWNSNSEKWMVGFEHAKAYFKEYGNLSVPKRYVCSDGYPLGSWIASQKQAYKNGKLDRDKAEMLGSIGMEWSSKYPAMNRLETSGELLKICVS